MPHVRESGYTHSKLIKGTTTLILVSRNGATIYVGAYGRRPVLTRLGSRQLETDHRSDAKLVTISGVHDLWQSDDGFGLRANNLIMT
jgi:hypothetical protein